MEPTTMDSGSISAGRIRRPLLLLIAVALTMTFVISVPNLLRSRSMSSQATAHYMQVAEEPSESRAQFGGGGAAKTIDGRKIVRNGSMTLIVTDVLQTIAQVESVARSAGGYVQSSSLARTGPDVRQAALRISVPADRLDDVRPRLRALSLRIEAEQVQSQEVTAEYTDLQSSLRNFRAEEQQYLAILQRAGTIRDTLEVARSLADVRGRIERTQGRLNLLDHQVAMATLDVSLRTDSLPVPAPARWQPLAHARAALQDALENLAGYVDFMVTVVLQLPVVLLWLVTLVGSAALAWRLFRWTWRRFFVPMQQPTE